MSKSREQMRCDIDLKAFREESKIAYLIFKAYRTFLQNGMKEIAN